MIYLITLPICVCALQSSTAGLYHERKTCIVQSDGSESLNQQSAVAKVSSQYAASVAALPPFTL